METLLSNIPGVVVYLDDILVSGKDADIYLRNLDQVMERLERAGLTLKQSKCTYGVSSVEYLGHVIDKDGLHPSPSKVEAIQAAPEPKDTTELKSFLGLLNYYSKFLPNLAVVLSPLYRLLHKKIKWSWSDKETEAFQKAKSLLQSSNLLVHYDSQKEIIVSPRMDWEQYWDTSWKMALRDQLLIFQGLSLNQKGTILSLRKKDLQ